MPNHRTLFCIASPPGLTLALAQAVLAAGLLLHEGIATAADSHSAHAAVAGQSRSTLEIALPSLKVTRADGQRMSLAQVFDDGRPVVLNGVYTSCNAICPITSQVFVELRERLGAERDKINIVSISIDPEQDAPRRFAEYAARFGSAGAWAHLAGSSADAIEIQRAFGAWRGDKMNHQPTTYLRAAPGKPWVRLDGLHGPKALLSEYLQTTGAQTTEDCSPAGKIGQALSLAGGARERAPVR